MHPVAASTRMSVRWRWPALRPPGGGFDQIGTYARTEAITFPEAIERLARAAGLLPADPAREPEVEAG